MNKRKWICLSVVFIVIILIAGIVIKHWNSLEALVDSFRYSQEEVVQKLDENKKQLQQYIDENEDVTVRDLTEEEAKLLSEGKISEEEIVKILTGQTNGETQSEGTSSEKEPSSEANNPNTEPTEEKPTEPEPSKGDSQKENPPAKNEEKKPTENKPSESKPTENKPVENKPEETEPEETPTGTAVSEAIAKLYVQKSIYLGKLDSIEARVNDEFYALLKSEHLDEAGIKEAKQQFLKTNLSTVAAWENECDSVVYGILDEIKAALKESNQDTDIVKKLEEAYLNEKRLKKSYYIKRYMD